MVTCVFSPKSQCIGLSAKYFHANSMLHGANMVENGEMDEYDLAHEELKQAKAEEQRLLDAYYMKDECQLNKHLDRLIIARILSKKDRNSLATDHDIFSRFRGQWSNWLIVMTPTNSPFSVDESFTGRCSEHTGYRMKTRILKRILRNMNVQGPGIFEMAKVKLTTQVQHGKNESLQPEIVVLMGKSAREVGDVVANYCRNGSHAVKRRVINKVLGDGYVLMIRGKSSQIPKEEEYVVLKKYHYPWTERYPDCLIYKRDPESNECVTGAMVLESEDKTKWYRYTTEINPLSDERIWRVENVLDQSEDENFLVESENVSEYGINPEISKATD